jgi:Carboxypeptidase regulatory-like domain
LRANAAEGLMRNWWRMMALAFPLAFLVSRLFAQGGATGSISGIVEDPEGGVIPRATVAAVYESTREVVRTQTADATGLFTFTLLPVGSYTLEVNAANFADAKALGVVVRVTETTRLTIILPVRPGQESVVVQADVLPIKTANATTGESMTGTTITELPLATQNFQQLLALSAGASAGLNSASQLGRGTVSINVNGGRDDNNNYQIEGIGGNDYSMGELNNTPLPSPDAIQEFRIATSLYDATQGRNGGGNINAILKTGTADVHFDIFEYFRNTSLDANDFFLNALGEPKPVIQQNIFGASVAGPAVNGRKLGYFFVNYQGARQRSGDSPGTIISTEIPYIPAQARISAATMQADCLPAGSPPIDPVAYGLLTTKSTQFGAGAGGYLYPVPTNVDASTPCGTFVPFAASVPGRFTDNQFTATWDKEFRGGKDHVTFRFFWSDSEQFQPFGGDSYGIETGGSASPSNLNFPLDIPLRNRFGTISNTHVFTSSLINEFRFGVNVIAYNFNNLPIVTAQQYGINRPTNNFTPDIYRFAFASFQFGPYLTQLQSTLNDSVSYHDTISYIRNKHTLRFGAEAERATQRRSLPLADNGILFFAPTGSQGSPGFLSDFQHFLLGQPAFSNIAGGLTNHDYHVPSVAFFVQDDYRVMQNLTLNIGLRNEFIGAPVDQFCHVGNVDPLLANTTGQPFFYPSCVDKFHLPGLVGTAQSSGLDNNWTDVWEPRIGFAYDVAGHHTISLRGGFGIYGIREDSENADFLSFAPPFLPSAVPVNVAPGSLPTLFSGLVPPVGQTNASFVPTPSIFQGFVDANGQPTGDTTQFPIFSGNFINSLTIMVPRKWIAPTLLQWNLTLERAIGKAWALAVGYVGTRGVHLRENSDRALATLVSPQNPITLTAPDGTKYLVTQNTAANLAARSPFLGISPTAYQASIPDANSHYHGLQITVSHRLGFGLYLQSAYTYSKSIDDTSTASISLSTRFNDQNNPRDSRAPSDFDRTHRSITGFAYQEPWFKDRPGFFASLLRGWISSGVLTLQSGTPFTVIDSAGGSAVGSSSPNLTTPMFAGGFSCANAPNSGSISSRINGYLNLGAFLPAPVVGPDGSTGYGDIARNCFRGPWQKNLDLSIGRIFSFREHQTLKFSADFFNVSNTPSFANPSVVDIEAGPSAFGRITSTVGTPRLIQFALRYSF